MSKHQAIKAQEGMKIMSKLPGSFSQPHDWGITALSSWSGRCEAEQEVSALAHNLTFVPRTSNPQPVITVAELLRLLWNTEWRTEVRRNVTTCGQVAQFLGAGGDNVSAEEMTGVWELCRGQRKVVCPLKMGRIDCSETSVNYHYWLRNDPEECSSLLLRGGSVKSRKSCSVRFTWCACFRSVSVLQVIQMGTESWCK